MLPKTLIRMSDGKLFTLDQSGRFYQLSTSMMAKPYKYTYERLMATGGFKPA